MKRSGVAAALVYWPNVRVEEMRGFVGCAGRHWRQARRRGQWDGVAAAAAGRLWRCRAYAALDSSSTT